MIGKRPPLKAIPPLAFYKQLNGRRLCRLRPLSQCMYAVREQNIVFPVWFLPSFIISCAYFKNMDSIYRDTRYFNPACQISYWRLTV